MRKKRKLGRKKEIREKQNQEVEGDENKCKKKEIRKEEKIKRSVRDKGINNRKKQTRGTGVGRRKQLKCMQKKR